MIWLGLIEVEAINGNNDLGDAKGAFVNVACKALSKEDFVEKVTKSFSIYDFCVLDIDEIEIETKMIIDNPDNAEKLELVEEVNGGETFAWGDFHTYEE